MIIADTQNTAGNSARAQEGERSSDGLERRDERRAGGERRRIGRSRAARDRQCARREAARALLHAGAGPRAPVEPRVPPRTT